MTYHAARLQRAANRRLDRTAALTAELERERIATYGSRSLWTQLRLQALAARRDAWHALAGGDLAAACEHRAEARMCRRLMGAAERMEVVG